VRPCSVVVGYQRFGGPCCLQHCKALQLTKCQLESSFSWKPQISYLLQ